jgi:hypothetical protein
MAGMFFSNLIMYFIIMTTAATLHAHGHTDITTARQAAEALRPLAGNGAYLLFTLGLIGTGMLWKSLRTSYPLGSIEMLEPEAARGDGFGVGPEGEMIVAAVVVGKWESRVVGGIPKLGGKVVGTFPASGFSTTCFDSALLSLQCTGHDCRLLFRFGP